MTEQEFAEKLRFHTSEINKLLLEEAPKKGLVIRFTGIHVYPYVMKSPKELFGVEIEKIIKL